MPQVSTTSVTDAETWDTFAAAPTQLAIVAVSCPEVARAARVMFWSDICVWTV